MYFIERLERAKLSNSEKLIVDYIMGKRNNIQSLSIQSISSETFVSPALIVRAAKKLGYSGWVDMKESLLMEHNTGWGVTSINANIPFAIGDSYHQIANNITMLEIDTLTDTFSLLDANVLNKATDLLKKCKRIDVYAQSYFLLLAEIFEQNMSLINKNVRICRLTAGGSFQAYNSDQDVCAILLPMSSHHQYIENIARILHDREVPIITMTPYMEDKGLSALSNVVIQTSAKEKNGVKLGN